MQVAVSFKLDCRSTSSPRTGLGLIEVPFSKMRCHVECREKSALELARKKSRFSAALEITATFVEFAPKRQQSALVHTPESLAPGNKTSNNSTALSGPSNNLNGTSR